MFEVSGHIWAQGRRASIIAVVLVTSFALSSSAIAQTRGDVDRAEGQLSRAEAQKTDAYRQWNIARHQLSEATQRFDEINRRREELSSTIARLEDRIVAADAEMGDLDERAKQLLVATYTGAGRTTLSNAFSTSTVQNLLLVSDLTDKAGTVLGSELGSLEAVRRQTDRLKEDLLGHESEVRLLEVEANQLVSEMSNLFQEAEAAYGNADAAVRTAIDAVRKERAEFEAAEARRNAAAADAARRTSTGARAGLETGAIPGFVCPIQGGASFVNSWGWPRSGGTRSHKGTDMYGSQGNGHPLVAVQSGTVKLRTVNLGGVVVYLFDDAGNRYYYAHTSGYAPGLTNGQRVNRGDVIAYIGSTGNAGGPHLHFQIHPNGGAAVNPYPTVREAC